VEHEALTEETLMGS